MKYDDKKRDDSDVHNFEKTITLRGRFKKTNNFEVANCKHVEPLFFFLMKRSDKIWILQMTCMNNNTKNVQLTFFRSWKGPPPPQPSLIRASRALTP